MATFGFSCSDEEKATLEAFVAKYRKSTGKDKSGEDAYESKCTTVMRIFNMAEAGSDVYEMKESGIDTTALDAALSSIKRLFVAAAESKITIEEEYNNRVNDLSKDHQAAEKKLSDLADKEKTEKEAAIEAKKIAETALKSVQEKAADDKEAAEKAIIAAEKATEESRKRAEAAEELAKMRDSQVSVFMKQVTEYKEKLDGYDALKKAEAEAQKHAEALMKQLEEEKENSKKDRERLEEAHRQKIEMKDKEFSADLSIKLANAETEKQKAVSEAEKHVREEAEKKMDALRDKLESRTESLAAVRQELVDLRESISSKENVEVEK